MGYELLRASTIRIFVQGDVTLPIYKVHGDTVDFNSGTVSSASSYAPSFVLALGIGWGRSLTRVHLVN